MERQLFDWESQDQVSDAAWCFQNCVLKVQVAHHKIGEEISAITIDFSYGTMTFHHDEENSDENFVLLLTVKQ